MIKFNKKLFIIPILAIGAFLLASCGGSKKSTTGKATTRKATTSSHTTTEVEPDYKKSERAMKNFGDKLAQYNYTIEGNGSLTTSVVSDDKVIFKYKHTVSNLAVMTIDNDETFQARIGKNQLDHIAFLDKKPAAVLASNKKRLPNYWFDQDYTHKTIWEYFVNDTNQVYHYKGRNSYDVASVIGNMCDFSTFQIDTMREVTMEFDKEDVSVATINALYRNGTSSTEYQQLTITITFGAAQTDPLVDEWMNDESRTTPSPFGNYGRWANAGEYALLLQSATKIHENIDTYIPFIDFASYAVTYNGDTFLTTDKSVAKIRDYHGTQENVNTYISYLTTGTFAPDSKSYEKVVVDGKDHYRLHVRSRGVEKCYIDIQVELDDNGLLLTIGLYYTGSTYKSLAEFNTAITAKDFVEFPTTDLFTDYDGLDYSYHAYESHTCLLDWKLYIIMTVKYTNQNAVKTYIDEYGELAKAAGYTYNKNDGAWVKSNREHAWHVEFTFKANNTLEIIAKVQDYVDPALIKQQVQAENFPTVDMTYETDAKNLIEYMKFQYGIDCSLAYEVRFLFDTAAESSQFITDYNEALLAAGFIDKQKDPESGMRIFEKGLYRIRSVSEGTFAGIDFYKFIES